MGDSSQLGPNDVVAVNLFGMQGVTGLNVYSLVVAVIGAVVFLVIYHAIRRRTV